MQIAETASRDHIRALVREVLANAGDTSAPERDSPPGPTAKFVSALPQSTSEPEFDRDESAKAVITEADINGLGPGAKLRVAVDARLTPLAADLVRERGIVLVHHARSGPALSRIIAVGADHGGYQMKLELLTLLNQLGQQVRDFGTHSEAAVDYPDIAAAVAQAVAKREADLGIIIDGAGVGSAIAANKVPGIRAAACYSVAVARNSRAHNDANVLTLGSGTIGLNDMRLIVQAWLTSEISEERHRKRVAKITAIEQMHSRS